MQIAKLDREIAPRAKEDEATRRLMIIPGSGPIAATAFVALALPIEPICKGRDSAAWLSLYRVSTQLAATKGSAA
ncbi:MAG: hypothetical protein H6916_13235 [Novosphingobium sp.]|uniref:hypothetical protein n=1 Tax=Novosphingobium sp. TaxID=1874826 RepID=UPI001E142FBD|nr:hypothetical protein [Novosphingobium sp.]MCB2057428.1 hypothetical protein [Novosphingobium sp.]MCP5387758.1 hypothetical protein [Novosphingobium sp.]